MGIVRYENATICDVTNGVDTFGEYTTTIAPLFTSRALVSDVSNALRISERYRIYQDLVNLTFNYTPNIKRVVDEQDKFSIKWRGNDWRVTDVRESDDRMKITLMCYRNDPETTV
jgi:archaellin